MGIRLQYDIKALAEMGRDYGTEMLLAEGLRVSQYYQGASEGVRHSGKTIVGRRFRDAYGHWNRHTLP